MFVTAAEIQSETVGPADEPALICADEAFRQAFHYWRGASGQRYLHSVYSLIGCPALPQANYILVRRDEDGSRTPLAIGATTGDTSSLNLADLRHRGAQLGANEVHIHLLAETDAEREEVCDDLRATQEQSEPVAVAA
ncbi:hypothetical protein [Methyloligella solikamskensis]|uniref:Uncharacterized protein n=1 Tax=Methyloligella solikamskensis TaxID=1177756 RepID=A0ABW3J6Z9_9HYPH